MSNKKSGLNRKQKQINCLVKTNRRSTKAHKSMATSSVIEMPNTQEAFAPIPVETISIITPPVTAKSKFPIIKKYKSPSIVVLCLTLILGVFQNCVGGGGGEESSLSTSQLDSNDLASIQGEYFLAHEHDKLVYLQINGNKIDIDLQLKNGSNSLYQESIGNLSSVGKNEFKIDYSSESCNSADSEIVKIKAGKIEGTLEFINASGKQYVFYKTSKYTIPSWVSSVTERYEDHSCSFHFFKTTRISNAMSVKVKDIECLNGVRKNVFSQVKSDLLSGFNFVAGVTSGETDTTVNFGYSAFGDVVGVAKVLNANDDVLGYNMEFSFCVDPTEVKTPPSFELREITTVTMASDIAQTINQANTGSISLANTKFTVGGYNGLQYSPEPHFFRSFDSLSSPNSLYTPEDPSAFAVPYITHAAYTPYAFNINPFTISWGSSLSDFVTRYEYCVGTSAENCNIAPWQNNGKNTSVNLSMPYNWQYMGYSHLQNLQVHVRAIDVLENASSIVSSFLSNANSSPSTTPTTTIDLTSVVLNSDMCALNPEAAYCSPNYCSVSPRPYGCLANGTNCFQNQTAAGCGGSSTVVQPNPSWGMFYPPSGSPPAGSCSSTVLPAGLTSAMETRKGTITINGKGKSSADLATEYLPLGSDAPNYLNTSSMLKSIAQAKLFFLTDSVLKLRIKVNPEPDSLGTASSVCYGRGTGAYLSGYTKLNYTVKVYAVSSTNSVSPLATLGPFTTSVNDCSESIDLSLFKQASPTGLIVTINEVMENKNCSPWNWNSVGWNACNTFNKVRSMECWSMDFEVAADGTKTFE
jgi:hypothetical protein